MAQITLTQLQTFIQTYVPNYPLKKCATHGNIALEECYDRLQQVEYSTFTTRAPTTTGTVSVTAGLTAVTFSGSVLATTDGLRVVQIGSDSTWYVVTRNAADTAGVLSSAYAGTTNATATYKIVYPTITFGSTVGIPLAIKREGYRQLDYAAASDLESRTQFWLTGVVGTPNWYTPYSLDAAATPNDAYRIMLTPFPDAAYAHEFQYLVRPAPVDVDGAGSQTFVIPQNFASALKFRALSLTMLAEQRDEDPWEGKAEKEFQKALAHNNLGAHGQRRGAFGMQRVMSAFQNPS